jgi:acyl-coenzyme A thioesterase PaaI-like protein
MYHEFIGASSFGASLGNAMLDIASSTREAVVFRYTVPDHLCKRTTDKASPTSSSSSSSSALAYLPVSAQLALFDELSTQAVMLVDKTSRAGVSINLSTEQYADTKPGDEVIIKCMPEKIGKRVGFIAMTMEDATSGKLLARGHHVKYLDQGAIWDTIGSATFLPFLLYFIETYAKSLMQSSFGKKVLSFFLPPNALSKRNAPRELTDGLDATYQGLKVSATPVNNIASFQVETYFCNPFKTLHGGAIGMGIEQSAHELLTTAMTPEAKQLAGKRMRAMEIRYLTPLKGTVHVATSVSLVTNAFGNGISTEGYAYRSSVSGNGNVNDSTKKASAASKPSVMFNCRWN